MGRRGPPCVAGDFVRSFQSVSDRANELASGVTAGRPHFQKTQRLTELYVAGPPRGGPPTPVLKEGF
eukprot:11490443-Alexandrium_andersonii.AAC.1